MKKTLLALAAFLCCNILTISAADFTGSITAVDKGTVSVGDEGAAAYITEGDEVTLTVVLSCDGLTQDITLSAIQPYGSIGNPADILSITPKTLKAAEADKATIAIKIKPSALGSLLYCISPGTSELSSYCLWLKIHVEPKVVGALGDFITTHPNGSEGIESSVEGDFVVTHVWEQPYSWGTQKRAYLQDASAGVFVHYYEGLTCEVGEHYNKIIGAWHYSLDNNSLGMYGVEGMEVAPLPATPTATDSPAEPAVITLADAAKHHGRLVHIKRVTVLEAREVRSDVLAIEDTIDVKVGETVAKITFFPGSDLLGEPAPTISGTIDLVGIVRTVGEGKITISPRSKADILAASGEDSTALENVDTATTATKIIENGQMYILKDGIRYNIFGIKIQ